MQEYTPNLSDFNEAEKYRDTEITEMDFIKYDGFYAGTVEIIEDNKDDFHFVVISEPSEELTKKCGDVLSLLPHNGKYICYNIKEAKDIANEMKKALLKLSK